MSALPLEDESDVALARFDDNYLVASGDEAEIAQLRHLVEHARREGVEHDAVKALGAERETQAQLRFGMIRRNAIEHDPYSVLREPRLCDPRTTLP